MSILETERLRLRELDPSRDDEFIYELLNTPKFLKYIGDRGVRSVTQAADFIRERYAPSYRENRFGLWVVELVEGEPIGMCGFLRRDTLPGPDLGFAFLPGFESQGYGSESAAAAMQYGRETLGLTDIYAITSLDNEVSKRLLTKLGFLHQGQKEIGGETLDLFLSTA